MGRGLPGRPMEVRMAVRRFAPLFLVFILGLPLFPRDAQDVPLCLRRPDPADHHVWPPLAFEPDDASLDSFFEDEVWAKVGERTCLNCHCAGGDAEERSEEHTSE